VLDVVEDEYMTFQIAWAIDETEWANARQVMRDNPRGGVYDRRREAFWFLLMGTLQFQQGPLLLFPQDHLLAIAERGRTNGVEVGDRWYPIPDDYGSTGIRVSLLDFADQFLRIVETVEASSDQPADARFRERDGGRQILLTVDGGDVLIRSDLVPDVRLNVPMEEFTSEAHRFFREFITALDQHVPGILDWVSFDRLRTYADVRGIITAQGDDLAADAARREYLRRDDWKRGEQLRAELRKLYVLHDNGYRDIETFAPGDPTCFVVEVTALIGPAGLTGEEDFEFVVCTPKWLTREPLENGFRWGQDHLFVDAWDPVRVHQIFRDLCHQTTGPDWIYIAMHLSHFGQWQRDQYRTFRYPV
jgi:hypothetical protein